MQLLPNERLENSTVIIELDGYIYYNIKKEIIFFKPGLTMEMTKKQSKLRRYCITLRGNLIKNEKNAFENVMKKIKRKLK